MEIKINMLKEQPKLERQYALTEPKEVYSLIEELWANFPNYEKERENFFCLYLDIKNRLLAIDLVSQGTISQCLIYPREIVKRSLVLNCSSLIFVHNHPSGDTTPSKHDIDMTNKIKTFLNTIDIQILDHIIIGTEYYSFQENGKL